MHYVRFLKGPTLRSSPPTSASSTTKRKRDDAAKSVYALITLETDLGDSIYYGDVTLTCSVMAPVHLSAPSRNKSTKLAQSDTGRTIAQMNVSWTGGLRSLAVEVSLPREGAEDPAALQLRVVAQNGAEATIQNKSLVMPVVIGQVAAVDGMSIEGRKQVGCPLSLENGTELLIWEDAGVSMARHVWDAGVALVPLLDLVVRQEYDGLPSLTELMSRPARSAAKLQVLELGAGCGVAGVGFTVLCPDSHVQITDVPDAERLVIRNIAANKPASGSNAEFKVLDWTEQIPQEIAVHKFDIVLVADCIYNEDSIPALVRTLSSLAAGSPDMLIVVATKTRHSSEGLFFDLAQKAGFQIGAKQSILAPAGDAADDLEDAERIDIYEFAVTIP